MASYAPLDLAGGPAARTLILLIFLVLSGYAFSQNRYIHRGRITEVRKLYAAKRRAGIVRIVPESTGEAADLELYRGLALAQLGDMAKQSAL